MFTKGYHIIIASFFCGIASLELFSQALDFSAVKATVDFSHTLQEWDGFGVNYVETSQTFDYNEYPQDYGSLQLLDPFEKDSVFNMVFGKDGLKVNLIKMFLDPLHQTGPEKPYDHETTTRSMREFVKAGIEKSKSWDGEISVITTLYGPPAYITNQKIIRGRDLDPGRTEDLVNYFIDWAAYLNKEGIPIRYISLHNEGESWLRWPQDGTLGTADKDGHDYNFFWSPEQVNKFIPLIKSALVAEGLSDIGVTNGEPTNWYRFAAWGYANAIASNQEVLDNIDLITSHGFYVGSTDVPRWFGPHTSRGIEMVRDKKPGIHAWVTSTSWNSIDRNHIEDCELNKRFVMDAGFVKEIHGNIYESKVNGIIPWALMQNATYWKNPDPNPGCAFRVYDDGTFEVEKAYYYYKQVTRAGQKGMKVVYTDAMDSEIAIIGFDANGTSNPDAFVIINLGAAKQDILIEVKSAGSIIFDSFRTTGEEAYLHRTTAKNMDDGSENYKYIGDYKLENNRIFYTAPAGSVTTFFAK